MGETEEKKLVRYGLLSDIHGNLEALEAVIGALKKEAVDGYICLGDIVGYGANPRECLELIEELNAIAVAGNHDYAAVDLTDIEYFNPSAKDAVLWTRNQLNEENKRFLTELKLVHRFPHFSIVHATLKAPEEWNYIFSTYDARQNFQLLAAPLLFIGHSHIPIVFEGNDNYRYSYSKVITLEEGKKNIINIGSVGQPRDGDARASFALYDTESNIVQMRRMEYDVTEAMRKIVEADLPRSLAWRLSRGE